jgi:hypothetical protein
MTPEQRIVWVAPEPHPLDLPGRRVVAGRTAGLAAADGRPKASSVIVEGSNLGSHQFGSVGCASKVDFDRVARFRQGVQSLTNPPW